MNPLTDLPGFSISFQAKLGFQDSTNINMKLKSSCQHLLLDENNLYYVSKKQNCIDFFLL